ncbi:MAG: division/cell wall cluster transcriptional repressor MraZ [Aristaeellaceae bacterium]
MPGTNDDQPRTDAVLPDAAAIADAAAAVAAADEALTEEDLALLKKYSSTFIGSYSHSLDAKGRLVVPLAFREQLGETFCIAPSFDFKSIALYPTLMWARMRDRYEKLGRVNAQLRRYLEQLDALSFRGQECDGQGRVLLPGKIRQNILGDEKDVEITGANDHVRIVARPAADEQFAAFMAELPDILDSISALEGQA